MRAAVVLVHGINMRPACMDELGALFAAAGCVVVRGTLSGHGAAETAADFAADGWRGWARDVRGMRARAVREAPRCPVFLCGFSLGATAGLAAALEGGPPGGATSSGMFAGMILISPALFLRPWAHPVRLLFPWPRLNLVSIAGPRIQARTKTPVRGYRALFDLIALVRQRLRRERKAARAAAMDGRDSPESFSLAAVPTLVLYDRRDILTRPPGLTRWLAPGHAWHFSRLRAKNIWHHLVTDRRALGDKEWARLGRLLAAWIAEMSASPRR